METLLVCVDKDLLARKVIDVAAQLASQLGASVTVCHVMAEEQYHKIEDQQLREKVEHPFSISQAEEQAKVIADDVATTLKKHRVRYETKGVIGEPAAAIVELAHEVSADLIVMGFEGLHGLGRLRALGSVSRAVMEQTDRPVLIVPAIMDDEQTV